MRSQKIQPRKRGANPNKLNPQQRLFVDYLLAEKNWNPTEAARKAGYKSPSSAAAHNLSNPTVAAILGKKITIRSTELQLKSNDVLRELAYIGFADPRRVFDENGQVKAPKDWPEDIARAIASVDTIVKTTSFGRGDNKTVIEEITYKVSFWSKPTALGMMGKHLGMFIEQLQSNVNHSIDPNLLKYIAGKVEEVRATTIENLPAPSIPNEETVIEGQVVNPKDYIEEDTDET